MPLPERYTKEVSDIEKIWSPEGYFRAQTNIWEAQTEARYDLDGAPDSEGLDKIRAALVLSTEDIDFLSIAKGHETNKLLSRVQSKLPTKLGNYLHLGNTSSDVLDTSLAMQILQSLNIIDSDFLNLGLSLSNLGITHKDTLQIARSHGQHAVPHTFGRQVMGWYGEVIRDITRNKMSKEMIAFGKLSGEVGTNINISPEMEEYALRKLGLEPDPAPTQVISRDRHATVLSLMAVNAGTLERISTNIRSLSRTEIGEVREPFDEVGSSAMPHKRNPELSERISGLSRVVRSAAIEELASQALWDERDISHSSTERFSFPDAFGCLAYSTRLTKQVIDGLVVNPQRMLRNIDFTFGAIYSSGLFNTLIGKGMARQQSHALVKVLAQQAMDEETYLRALVDQNPEITGVVTSEELDELFDHRTYTKNIGTAYKRLGLQV